MSTHIIRFSQNGTIQYLREDGLLDRPNGPAIICRDGSRQWWRGGRLHRRGGPAVVWANGTQEYWSLGRLHRRDGPAIIWPDGCLDFWEHGEWLRSVIVADGGLI